jgi:hypothetical protein
MNNKVLLGVLLIGCIGVFLVVSKSGVLSRFNTISAHCELSGLGTLKARYQYSSTNELISVNLNGLEIDQLRVALSRENLNIFDANRSIKIDLKNKKIFATLNNKSFSGNCTVDNFKM